MLAALTAEAGAAGEIVERLLSGGLQQLAGAKVPPKKKKGGLLGSAAKKEWAAYEAALCSATALLAALRMDYVDDDGAAAAAAAAAAVIGGGKGKGEGGEGEERAGDARMTAGWAAERRVDTLVRAMARRCASCGAAEGVKLRERECREAGAGGLAALVLAAAVAAGARGSGSGGGGGGTLECACAVAARHACAAALRLCSPPPAAATPATPAAAAAAAADAASDSYAVALGAALEPHLSALSLNVKDPLFPTYWVRLCGCVAHLPDSALAAGLGAARLAQGRAMREAFCAQLRAFAQVAPPPQPRQQQQQQQQQQEEDRTMVRLANVRLDAATMLAVGCVSQAPSAAAAIGPAAAATVGAVIAAAAATDGDDDSRVGSSAAAAAAAAATAAWPAPLLPPPRRAARHAPRFDAVWGASTAAAVTSAVDAATRARSAPLLHAVCRMVESLGRRLGPRLDETKLSAKARRGVFMELRTAALGSPLCRRCPYTRSRCLGALLWLLPVPEGSAAAAVKGGDGELWARLEARIGAEMTAVASMPQMADGGSASSSAAAVGAGGGAIGIGIGIGIGGIGGAAQGASAAEHAAAAPLAGDWTVGSGAGGGDDGNDALVGLRTSALGEAGLTVGMVAALLEGLVERLAGTAAPPGSTGGDGAALPLGAGRRDGFLLPLLLRLLLRWHRRRASAPCTELMLRVWELGTAFGAAARRLTLAHVLLVLDFRPACCGGGGGGDGAAAGAAAAAATAAAAAAAAAESAAWSTSDDDDDEDTGVAAAAAGAAILAALGAGGVGDGAAAAAGGELALVPLRSHAMRARRGALWFLGRRGEVLAELAIDEAAVTAAAATARAATDAIAEMAQEAARAAAKAAEAEAAAAAAAAEAAGPAAAAAAATPAPAPAMDLLGLDFGVTPALLPAPAAAAHSADLFGLSLGGLDAPAAPLVDVFAAATAAAPPRRLSMVVGDLLNGGGASLLDLSGGAMAAAAPGGGPAAAGGMPLPNRAIQTILDRLWHAATFEDSATRRTCADALAKLALRVKEPVSERASERTNAARVAAVYPAFRSD